MAPPQRKTNKRARKRRRPPWGDLFDGKPIERWRSSDLPDIDAQLEGDARAEQCRRAVRIMQEHYGIQGATGRRWFEFSIALLQELDPALRTVVKPLRPKHRQWVGADGLVLLSEVKCFGEALRKEAGKEVKLEAILAEVHRVPRYRTMSPGHLNTAYHTAKRYHDKKSRKRRARTGTGQGAP